MRRFARAPPMSRVRGQKLDVDRCVSSRIRRRRIMLGLTQVQMAKLIGATKQQAHKYETCTHRISAGRLHQIANALGVEISYFFKDVDSDSDAQTRVQRVTPQERMLLDLARDFVSIKSRVHQEALCRLARALSYQD